MSIESEQGVADREFALLAQIGEFDADQLTDHLVEALYEALRILKDEIAGDTLH
ncbi:hypothetical protein ACQQ2Q_20850 [Agrobacterium sp. ES01]|uniref:hypothetical protein n=1 Tax=Agrobacterium sp. ES01 TaxID=3420714 RepID=UPI003D124411